MGKRSKMTKDATSVATSDGYTHVFSEFGTSKMIQIVLPKNITCNL